MHLRHLEIRNIRILRDVGLELDPGINLFVGRNGSGKTSLLEGVHLLGVGRTFRGRRIRDLIRRDEESAIAFGRLSLDGGAEETLGIERSTSSTRIRIQGETVKSASALARLLPLLLISPESYRLLTDGADLRRRLFDWALFHVEQSYLGVYNRYRRALRQRNAELRTGQQIDAVTAWDPELATAGEAIHAHRLQYVQKVIPVLNEVAGKLLAIRVSVEYEAGWDSTHPLAEIYAETIDRDVTRGYTGRGPHRADLRFLVEGAAAHDVLSRGEGKLFVMGVLLSQVAYLLEHGGRPPILLVDDLASELDAESRGRFLEAARGLEVQTLVTAVSNDLIDTTGWSQRKVFHVEQGEVSEMV